MTPEQRLAELREQRLLIQRQRQDARRRGDKVAEKHADELFARNTRAIKKLMGQMK